MSTEAQVIPAVETKQNDKEFNFRQLESKYKNEIDRERQARHDLEKKLDELAARHQSNTEVDDDNEPYVNSRRLEKKLANFGQSTKSEIEKGMERAKIEAKEELKQELWLENNPDFFDVLQHAEKFAQSNPILAETILKMPDNFERKKLVYANIKAMNLHKPPPKESSIQDKIDGNRRNVFYQPSGVGTAPFQPQGDFSEAGMKSAYEKMQQSKAKLRLG
jgi:hypothetical protein